jgi:hypothetical protein
MITIQQSIMIFHMSSKIVDNPKCCRLLAIVGSADAEAEVGAED